MKVQSILKGVVLTLSGLGLLLPQAAVVASQPQPGSPGSPQVFRISDVALGPQDTLQGTVVDRQGQPLPGAPVALMQRDRQVAKTSTDAEGRFAVANVPWGVYTVGAAGGVGTYRLWPERIAPPSANRGVLIVSAGQVVRGQNRLYQWVADHYLLTCAGIATAIVVPVVLVGNETNDKDKGSP